MIKTKGSKAQINKLFFFFFFTLNNTEWFTNRQMVTIQENNEREGNTELNQLLPKWKVGKRLMKDLT